MPKVNPSIFKAYDIRGIYPDEINEKAAYKIGRAFVMFLSKHRSHSEAEPKNPVGQNLSEKSFAKFTLSNNRRAQDDKKLKNARDDKGLEIIIGRDIRLSSPAMRESLIKGIIEQGADIIDIGVCTSPMHYYAVSRNHAEFTRPNFAKQNLWRASAEPRGKNLRMISGGIIVTASHNPKEYNGFKILSGGGVPVGENTGMNEIRDLVEKNNFERPLLKGKITEKDISGEYIDFVIKGINISRKLKIAIDGSNGTVGLILPKILGKFDLDYKLMHFEPDGNFPNHDPNPTKEENLADLKKKVLEEKADLGVAFDGDGDRVVFIDEEGERISSDSITLLIALGILDKKRRVKIIHDLTLSKIVRETIREKGGIPIQSRVGHTCIKNKMREMDAEFGGERSGHYFFKEFFYGDSGILAVLKVLEILSLSEKKISELASPFQKYYSSGEVNFEIKDKDAVIKKIESRYFDAEISHIDGLTVEYKDWWFNVRPSNTEPLLRLNLEADTEALFEEKLAEVRKLIENQES